VDTGSFHGLGFGGHRHLGFGFGLLGVLRRSGVMNDLVIAVLVALAAVIASGLLDRIWDAL
jgi:hypothetical protein